LFAVVELHERMAIAGEGGRASFEVESEQVRPACAEKVSDTVLEKPLTALTVIIELPMDPTFIEAGVTDPADTVKSTMLRIT